MCTVDFHTVKSCLGDSIDCCDGKVVNDSFEIGIGSTFGDG